MRRLLVPRTGREHLDADEDLGHVPITPLPLSPSTVSGPLEEHQGRFD